MVKKNSCFQVFLIGILLFKAFLVTSGILVINFFASLFFFERSKKAKLKLIKNVNSADILKP
jgi:hypothetical protein